MSWVRVGENAVEMRNGRSLLGADMWRISLDVSGNEDKIKREAFGMNAI